MYLNSIIFSIKNQDFESSTEFMDEFYIDKMAIIQSVTMYKKCRPKVMFVSSKIQYI